MERFIIDERAPCHLREQHREAVRTRFVDPEATFHLGRQVTVVPMLRGFHLSTGRSALFVDDLHLLEQLTQGGVVPARCSDQDRHELEQYHAHGLLTSDPTRRRAFKLCDQGERYRHLYDPAHCTWFSMSPLTLELDLTNQCNQLCNNCCATTPRPDSSSELSSHELCRIIGEAAEIGVTEIAFVGNEPTSRPDLLELAYFARKRGIDALHLRTNALHLDDHLLEPLAVLFSSIRIPVHGATADAHDAVTRERGAFDRVVANVERLRFHRARIILEYTAVNVRPRELSNVHELGHLLGVQAIRFVPMVSGQSGCLASLPSRDSQEFSWFMAHSGQHPSDLWATDNSLSPGEGASHAALYYGCTAGLSKLRLDAYGYATGCSLLAGSGLDGRTRSLLEIWHSQELRRLRARVVCDCAHASRCAGGCISLTHASAGAVFPG